MQSADKFPMQSEKERYSDADQSRLKSEDMQDVSGLSANKIDLGRMIAETEIIRGARVDDDWSLKKFWNAILVSHSDRRRFANCL